MEPSDMEGTACGATGAFVFHSRPRCSMTRTQARGMFWALAGVSFGVAIAFSALGYWMILPFAGLEVGILAWAFEAVRRREGDFETLTIDGDAVVLEWSSGRSCGRREMNRQWMRVELDCAAPGRNCRVSVRSHGRGSEVGQFLSDEARLQLAATLRHRLQT
ncbi:MAG: DUF2244 domain-containing protein [Pseudomonadota bacterium]